MRIAGFAVASIAMVLHAASIEAGESITGRWALDLASCGHDGETPARSPLIVTDYAVRWFSDACRIGRMYKTGDTVHIQALCWGSQGEHSVPVSLRPHGGRLQVRWDRAVSGDMRRCP